MKTQIYAVSKNDCLMINHKADKGETTMRTKLISTITLVALICAAFMAGVVKPLEVFAATKTATLVDTKVSFDGKTPVTVQSYRLDGYNYVRVAEIAKHINMGVIPATYETGVVIQINTPYTGGELEKLTENSITTELTTGTVFYDGMRYENAECFKYNNRYYYKLADLIAASQYALEQNIVFTERYASGNHWKEAAKKTFTTFDIDWDGTTSTVNVNRKVTDLQKMFDDIRSGKAAVAEQKTQNIPVTTAKPELTSAPEVGTVLADILIDKVKGAYNADKTVNKDNLTENYKNTSSSFGQCTWYAVARFRETTGINPCAVYGFFGSSNWVEAAKSGEYPNITGITDVNDIRGRCIAEWKDHVLFVEYVERDSGGNPVNVYFTEVNTQHDGVYYPDKDAKVQKLSFERFINRDSRSPLRGYIVAK